VAAPWLVLQKSFKQDKMPGAFVFNPGECSLRLVKNV